MIVVEHGDLLKAEADILVNPVNTVGVMGAGLAKQFRERFPKMFEDYRRACKEGKVYIKVENGKIRYRPHVYLEESFIILNLPTKTHWKLPSRYEYVIAGLRWIRVNYEKLSKLLRKPIRKIAMPFLGCGCGGLSRRKVLELIIRELYDLPCDIYIYTL